MNKRIYFLILLLILAAAFWIEMFVLKNYNFWIEMTIASGFLALVSVYINHLCGPEINYRLYYYEFKYVLIGVFSAVILYFIFYGGDIISIQIFNFANAQVTDIYSNKSLLDPSVIGLLLLFIIGPSEEIFWRGFVQDTIAQKLGDNAGWLIAALIYGCIHLVAMNLMLFTAALICGLFWGYIYKRYRSLWPGIISHALWDLVIFVLLPVR
jgi:membrane protease YdiL (CAAX protease family)